MTVKKMCAVLFVAALVWGCAKVETPAAPDTTPEAIRMKPAVSTLRPVSRVPFTDDLSSETLTAWVPATLTQGNYTTTYADGTMTFSGTSTPVTYNALDFTGNNNLPDGSDTPLYLCGFYPAAGWTQSGSQATIPFTGCEDIMMAAEVLTTKRKVRVGEFATLAFKHQLTLLEITIRAEDAKTVAKWGNVSGMEVLKTTGTIETSLTVNMSGSTVTFGTPGSSLSAFVLSAAGGYTNTPYTGTTLVAGGSELVAYILAPPLSATDPKKYKFNVKTLKEGTETVSPIEVDLNDVSGNPFTASTAGYSFKVTFYFQNGEITAQAAVTEWQSGGTTVVPV